MVRMRLLATVAAAPLLLFAGVASAETTISNNRTTPISTSTANGGAADDVKIAGGGKIELTTAGPAVTVDSSNDFTNDGSIVIKDVDNAIGVLVQGGNTTDVANNGTIVLDDDYTPKDDDKDGDDDGPLAEGENKWGIKVVGPGALTGSIKNTGSIQIAGNNSGGISLETDLVGDFVNSGTVSVVGTNAVGINIAGNVTGATNPARAVEVRGTVSVIGENAVGLDVSGDVAGTLLIQGGISARGYRYSSRPFLAETRAKLDDDDKLQGGSAVRVTSNITGGILLDVAPADEDEDEDDEDGDGVIDTAEGAATITVLGEAPAIQIGSETEAITIGNVGVGDNAYGLIIRGTVSSDGLLDNVSSTGIQIGTDSGNAVDLGGGIRMDGALTARTYNSNARALWLRNGASADVIDIGGIVSAVGTTTSAPLASETPILVVGLQIDQLANVGTLRIDGTVAATGGGERVAAYGIVDLSGTVTLIETTGNIVASVITTDDADDGDDTDTDPSNEAHLNTAVAIDVSANTTGVTIRQTGRIDGDDGDDDIEDADEDGDGVDDADEPNIVGDIRFGSGADVLDLRNGVMTGSVSFGDGADTFILAGGADFKGGITDTDGQLDIDIANGKATITNAQVINATSLNVGADSSLTVTIDPTANGGAGANTMLVVNTATFANGAAIGVELTDLIDGPQSYTIVQAGTLTAGTLDQELLGNSPYLFVAEARADEAAGEVYVDVRRRTAAEMNLNAGEAAALDAVYEALSEDEGVRDAFLATTDRKDFLKLYDQLLPDQGEGLFSALDLATLGIARLTGTRPDLKERYGPDSFWLQEINVGVLREAGVSLGSETKAFGFIGGYEAMGDDGGALGVTLAYLNAEEKDDVAQVGEQTNISLVEAGVYWRRAAGPWLFSVRGAAGYGWFEGERRFVDPSTGLVREASATWGGYTLSANAMAGYEARFGRFYVRPTLSVDYFYLSEGERRETGGGGSFNLIVDERTSSRLSASAELAVGATFGRDTWWRPELRVGYRQILAGEIGDTTARFTNGTTGFTLTPMEAGEGAVVLGLALRAGTPMSYMALEGEVESSDGEERYNLRVSGRMMF